MKTQKMMMMLGSILITLTLMAAIRAGFAGPQQLLPRIGTPAAVPAVGVAMTAPHHGLVATAAA
ncbi:MAG TPA: hypothetical protein VND63_07380 [Rhodanobacteraceae bacterium]|nr:hypothetical protein [Rhodanobacteraceae bacterium]